MNRPDFLPPRGECGSALILVLWVLALLSLLASSLLIETRPQTRQSHASLRYSQALVAAEAGVPMAVQKWLSEPRAFSAQAEPVEFRLDGFRLFVRVRSEHGKLDLNFCQMTSFEQLVRVAGASEIQARAWGAQLQRRREASKPLTQLEELLEVTSMDSSLFQRIEPWLTLWSGRGKPDPGLASEPVREALGLKLLPGSASNPGSILEVETRALGVDGGEVTISQVVRLNSGRDGLEPYQILLWRVVE